MFIGKMKGVVWLGIVCFITLGIFLIPGSVQAQTKQNVTITVATPAPGATVAMKIDTHGIVYSDTQFSRLFVVAFLRPLASPDWSWFSASKSINSTDKKKNRRFESAWRCAPIYAGTEDSKGERFEITYRVMNDRGLNKLLGKYPGKKIDLSDFNAENFFGSDLFGTFGPIEVRREL